MSKWFWFSLNQIQHIHGLIRSRQNQNQIDPGTTVSVLFWSFIVLFSHKYRNWIILAIRF